MSLAVGPITQLSVTGTGDSLSVAAATGGTGPYTYQWYRSTTTGFSPGAGNLIAGATALTFMDSGLIPNTTYFYKVRVTDTGHSNDTADSAQLAVVTSGFVLSPNQFQQSAIVGLLDLRFPPTTVSVEIDTTQVGSLYAGSPVKIVPQSASNQVPRVIGCSANSDECFGFLNYDIKTQAYSAGLRAEVSLSGNVMYLYATGAITQGAQVRLDLLNNGVAQVGGSSGAKIVGWAYDGAAALGSLIRVFLKTPSFLLDT